MDLAPVAPPRPPLSNQSSLSPQDHNQNQQQRTSAPYGHACANCAKAKCKCVSRGGGGGPPGPGTKCERCYRLGRECTPSATVRKRGSTRRSGVNGRGLLLGSVSSGSSGGGGGGVNSNSGGDTARTAQLEEKLDDLVSLLRSQQASTSTIAAAVGSAAAAAGAGVGVGVGGSGGSSSNNGGGGPTPHQIPTPESSTSEDNMPRLRLRDIYPFASLAGTAAANHVSASACYQPLPGSAAPNIPELTRAQAEECLDIFRENHLRFFPFVHIAADITAEEIQRDRPFLWLNIRALGCKSSVQQAAQGQRIREIIGQQVLANSERTMDLLLGLLGFLGWGMVQAMGRPVMAVFTGIATGMVSDLRLDKPPHFNPLKEAHAFKPYRFTCAAPWTTTERTYEQRRAVLACYVISAKEGWHPALPRITYSNFYFLKTQIMRWTPHMEEALHKLSDEPEWRGDQVLAFIVRIFKVLEDFSHVQWSVSDYGSRPSAPRPTAMYYVKALRANLDDIRRKLPSALQDDRMIQTYLYSAEAQINDLPMQSPIPSSPPGFIDFGRTECFDLCVRAIKMCLENYFSFEPAEYIGFAMPMFLHYARATQILYRLSLTDDPAWDRAAIRHTVDLVGALAEGEARFAAVARAAGLESDGPDGGDMYTKGANALRATIPIWRASLEHVGAIPPSTTTASAGGASGASGIVNNGINGDNNSSGVSGGVGGGGGGGVHSRAATTDIEGPVDATMGDAGVGVIADMNSVELPSADIMQDFMMMDFVDDPWITDFFTWESPMR